MLKSRSSGQGKEFGQPSWLHVVRRRRRGVDRSRDEDELGGWVVVGGMVCGLVGVAAHRSERVVETERAGRFVDQNKNVAQLSRKAG